jgi:ADP-ribosylglycohydrolase
MSVDKLKGVFIALALGDALGAPHEFRYSPKNYTGKLEFPIKHINRFHGETVYPVGTVTDDTSMTLVLANQITIDRRFVKDNVILAYEKWANGTKMLGKNTRELFKGIKTVKGYNNRYQKKFSEPVDTWTQSNGSLMRCSPFVIFKEYLTLIEDTKLSNPHPVNQECGVIYINVMHHLFYGGVLPNIEKLLEYANQPPVRDVILDVKNKVIRDVAPREVKGWVCTALYCALYSIYHIEDIREAFKFFINKNGDTDTNAAILGALYGAKYGFKLLYEQNSENIDILISANDNLKNLDILVNNLISSGI